VGTKEKIVIVGGGPAGLAAALSLTDPQLHPDWQDHYEVEVLQLGWRVGGKGATGRQGTVVPDGAGGWRLEGDARIEEHGIHLFGNMYTNAMRLLDTCLQELDGPPIDSQLTSSNYAQLSDFWDHRWHLTPEALPYNDMQPWGPEDYPGPEQLVPEILRVIKALWDEVFGPGGLEDHHEHRLTELIERHRGQPHLPDADAHGHALLEIEQMTHILRAAWQQSHESGDSEAARIRSVWCQVELYGTILRGTIADQIFQRGIDVIDDLTFMDWLRRNGMHEEAVDSSPAQMAAQLCFQFPHGDTTGDPLFSAAGYLWFVLRQLLACGQATYWFDRGTGDTVVAPFYRTAVQRGVTFRFFRKVSHVRFDPATKMIEAIEADVQATTTDGTPYQPLVTVPDGTLAWPNRPIYGQLTQGEQLRDEHIDLESWWTPWQPVAVETLERGVDFDEVVLATPLPCLPIIAPELVADAGWAPAVEAMPGIETVAAQLWFNETTQDLGFPELPGTDRVVGGAAVNPLGLADFTDVLAAENWEPYGADAPKGLIYVCGPMAHRGPWPAFDQTATPAIEDARAKATVVQWLRTLASSSLVRSGTQPVCPAALDFDLLWCPPDSDAQGEERFDHQYWRMNIDPNERYVPSPPGTAALRPQAWESDAENLALASDWIFTGMNIGSFEGAIMSGYLAAHALTGLPALQDIPGYYFARPHEEPPPA
jgi:uncharacterized protein with NAD-binding domain and iron-sulfur cluster